MNKREKKKQSKDEKVNPGEKEESMHERAHS